MFRNSFKTFLFLFSFLFLFLIVNASQIFACLGNGGSCSNDSQCCGYDAAFSNGNEKPSLACESGVCAPPSNVATCISNTTFQDSGFNNHSCGANTCSLNNYNNSTGGWFPCIPPSTDSDSGSPGTCSFSQGYCSRSYSCNSGYLGADPSQYQCPSQDVVCCIPSCGGITKSNGAGGTYTAQCMNTVQQCASKSPANTWYPYDGSDFSCSSSICCVPPDAPGSGPTPTGGPSCSYSSPPSAPSGLATHTDSTLCQYQDFNWTATANATGYVMDWWFYTIDGTYHECHKTEGSNSGYISVNDNNVGEGTAGGDLCWTDKSNLQGGIINLAVFADNCIGESAASTKVTFSPVTAAPSVPQNLAASAFCQANGTSTIKWTWSGSSNAIDYTHDRWYTPPGGTYTETAVGKIRALLYQIPAGTSGGWSDAGMNVGAAVKARNACGYSAYSSSVTVATAQCTFTESGTVFTDTNADGIQNNGESGTANVTVQLTDSTTNTTQTLSTDAQGNYSFSGVDYGDAITISLPAQAALTGNVVSTYNNPTTIASVTGSTTTNFGITPAYQISGYVYNDVNKSYSRDGSDTYISPGPTITISGGILPSPLSITAASATGTNPGLYSSGQALPAGTYTVTYKSALPGGYTFENNLASYIVTVGAGCNAGGNAEASCGAPDNNESVNNLNFALNNENAWTQPVCSDARYDGGYSQFVPSTASCSGTSGPYAIVQNVAFCPNYTSAEILFSGSTDPQYGQGLGPSTGNTVVGDSTFPESFTSRIPNAFDSSYNFVMTTLNNLSTTPTPLPSVCADLKNCDLSTLPPGVYTTKPSDGAVTFTLSDPSSQLAQGKYTFVLGGDVTFTAKVLLQASSSAAFISGGDIHVTGNVGESDWTSTATDLQGFYSTDKNFYIDSTNPAGQQCLANGQPKELKLNTKGSLVVNAAGNGGAVLTNRDGCLQDLSCPAATFAPDPQQILHAPGPLKPPYTFWQELNP